MKGRVDQSGRALVAIAIRSSSKSPVFEIDAWIDTGFNGDLVLPQQQIEAMALPQSGTVKAVLADGSEISLATFACQIDWFDENRYLEVVANSGDYPLLGVGLLLDHDLHISYRTGEITIE